jgi:alginate O-acetyltransferase complex protein AlgI
MLFTDGNYPVFLIAAFFIYWIAALRLKRVPVLLLLAISCYFYALWSPKYLLLIIGLGTVDFLCAREIGRSTSRRRRKLFLAFSLLTDLGALVLFKYFNFFSESLAALLRSLHFEATPFVLNVLWPLGISFITFRSLSYVLDVYRGTIEPSKRFAEYLAFVTFFPVVVAGPVVRASELLPQFRTRPALSGDEGSQAILLILLGLVKKIAIADYLANNLVGRVFDQPQLYSSIETLCAIYGYAIQIYCDFSGYSDIAIGSALLLGFRLPQNFNAPYTARNLVDFWRRWHITLSNWLTDYVYFSIGGLRKRTFNTYRNVIITMIIGGLWHGAAWTFIVWGLMHGLGLAATRRWQKNRGRRVATGTGNKVLPAVATFHFVCLTWVFFRADSMAHAFEVLKRLAALRFDHSNLAPSILAVLCIGLVLHVVPRTFSEKVGQTWNKMPSPVQAAVIVTIGVGLYFIAGTEVQFIYGNF